MDFKQYSVREIVGENSGVRTFKLVPAEGGLPEYKAGHFFLLRLSDAGGKPIHRPYSVASAPWEDSLQFCIKRKGNFPELLWKLATGSKIEVGGPYGIFLLKDDDNERVFIGGGVGISALRSMILQSVKDGKKCSLFHSAHEREGLVYFAQMQKLADENPNFKFRPSITCENVPAGWGGLTGRVDVAMLKRELGALSGKTFYLCGSKEMAGSLAASLAVEGVPKENIRKDEWG